MQRVLTATWLLVSVKARLHKKVGRIDEVVADELKGRSVIVVRTRNRYDVDQPSGVHATLRAQNRGFHTELANSIGERQWDCCRHPCNLDCRLRPAYS